MPEIINGYINTPINLNYVQGSPDVTQAETELAAIARLDGESGLAASDFSQDLIWKYDLSSSEAVHLSSPEQLLQKHKTRMVEAIIRQRFPEISDIWQELYIERFALLIVRNSSGVVALNDMLTRLLDVLPKHATLSSENVNVWTVAWLSIYRLGEIHDQWLADGNVSILPDAEGLEPGTTLNDFVESSLQRLENGQVHVGKMAEELESSALAVYDQTTDTLQFDEQLFQDPVIVEQDGAAVFTLVVHEMFHSWQDANKSSLPLMAHEAEAELFDSKASFLLFGEEHASRSETGFMGHVMQSMFMDMALQDVLSPIKVIVSEYLNPESEQTQHEAFRVYRDAVALEELKTGVIDPVKREQIKVLYTQQRLFSMFYGMVNFLDNKFASDIEYIKTPKFRREMRQMMRQTFSRKERYSLEYEYNTATDPVYEDYLAEFVAEAAMKFFLVYYKHGEEFAHTYFNDVVEPALYAKAFPDAMERIVIAMDGIPGKDESLATLEL